MPGGDQTGPMGMGPMTGRGAGYCNGFAVPGRIQMAGFAEDMEADSAVATAVDFVEYHMQEERHIRHIAGIPNTVREARTDQKKKRF